MAPVRTIPRKAASGRRRRRGAIVQAGQLVADQLETGQPRSGRQARPADPEVERPVIHRAHTDPLTRVQTRISARV